MKVLQNIIPIESREIFCTPSERRILGFSAEETLTFGMYDEALWSLSRSKYDQQHESTQYIIEVSSQSTQYSVHPLTWQLLRIFGYNPVFIYALALTKSIHLNDKRFRTANLMGFEIKEGPLSGKIIQINQFRESNEARFQVILPISEDVSWNDRAEILYSTHGALDFPISVAMKMVGQNVGQYMDHPELKDIPNKIANVENQCIKLRPLGFQDIRHLLSIYTKLDPQFFL